MQPYEGPVNVFAASPDIPPVPGVLKDFRLILGGKIMILNFSELVFFPSFSFPASTEEKK